MSRKAARRSLSDDLERIFEPFERTEEEKHGNGARARDRTRVHRGERRPDLGRVAGAEGTSFSLAFPIATGQGRGADVSGPRVLVVDDEPQILQALQTTLRGAGYEMEAAATGEAALAQAAVRPPDAVILDLVLPGKGAGRTSAGSCASGRRSRSSSSPPSGRSGGRSPRSTRGRTTT